MLFDVGHVILNILIYYLPNKSIIQSIILLLKLMSQQYIE
jgi:hypothetical protein